MDHNKYLLRTVELSKQAIQHGNYPFGALLTDNNGNIILEQENIEVTERDCTGHAETTLMRNASKRYDKEFLATCTLYTTGEPCVMCAGAIYWGNVLRVVYGITEKELLSLTGDDPRNLTLGVDCRTVYASGQKKIEVIGPFPGVADAIVEPHRTFWTKKSHS
jgi:tRNA(Arg) A34 adenosine deaminase TadA